MSSIAPAFNDRLRITEPYGAGGMLIAAVKRLRSAELPRTGLHCSTIVNDIIQTLYPKKYTFLEEESLAYQEFGNVIEDICAEVLRRRNPQWVKPRPKKYKGIWCSPDGWHPRTRTIDEIKATWVSERDFIDSPKLHGYLLQSLEYAYAWDALRVRLHVFFVNGKYPRGAPIPNPRTFVVRWDDGVPEHNHRILWQHAIDRKLVAA